MKQHILFDLDGTLTDPGEGITNSVRYALERLGRPVPGFAVLRRFVGPPLDEAFMQFCGLSRGESNTAIDLFREYFAEKGIQENELFAGMPQLLESLQSAGRRLYVATSKPEVFANQVLQRFGLAQYFEYVAGSPLAQAGFAKADIIRRVLQQNKIAPAAAVMVGDRSHDILGAKATGLLSVGVLYGYGDAAEMAAAGADYTAADLPALQALLLADILE